MDDNLSSIIGISANVYQYQLILTYFIKYCKPVRNGRLHCILQTMICNGDMTELYA